VATARRSSEQQAAGSNTTSPRQHDSIRQHKSARQQDSKLRQQHQAMTATASSNGKIKQ